MDGEHSSAITIIRRQVFALADGTLVVQWKEAGDVQELWTGQWRLFDWHTDFGHLISNSELAQLRASGRVIDFDEERIWLQPLPESGRFGSQRAHKTIKRQRHYYLATTYPGALLNEARALLVILGLENTLSAKILDNRVVVMAGSGRPFSTKELAEKTLTYIRNKMPHLARDMVISFQELKETTLAQRPHMMHNDDLDLGDAVLGQQDIRQIQGKLVVLAINQPDERQAFADLLTGMELKVEHSTSAAEVMQLLEDYPARLLIMDMQLPDIHAWKMISKLREIANLAELPIMVITNQAEFGMTVAKVDYLTRPVSIARLRQKVWSALAQQDDPGTA